MSAFRKARCWHFLYRFHMHIVRFLDRNLFRLVSVLAQLLIVSAAGAAFYQVLARFILQSPADWSEA